MKITSGLVAAVLLLSACQHEIRPKANAQHRVKPGLVHIEDREEMFIDSTQIAVPGKYKLQLKQETVDEQTTVHLNLYRKETRKWKMIQACSFEKETYLPLNTEISDFNNDHRNDFKICFGTAGRGANNIDKLFVFDNKQEKFITIMDSEWHPNLAYNKELDCVTCMHVYGGTMTEFLKIQADSFIVFARVEYQNDSVFAYFVKDDIEKLLSKDKYRGTNDVLIRFSNFNPIEDNP